MTKVLTIDEALKETIITNAIKDTGFNINKSDAVNNYQDIIKQYSNGKDVWYLSASYIKDLPTLIPFFKEKGLVLFITLDEYYYHTGVYDEYGERSEWVLTEGGKQRREKDIEFLLSLGFTSLSKLSYILC